MSSKKLMLSQRVQSQANAGIIRDAVDFDGVEDHLSRGGLLGTDSKAFTLSLWLYPVTLETGEQYINFGSDRFVLYKSGTDKYRLLARNPDHTSVVVFSVSALLVKDTWTHIVMSVDTTDLAKRNVYVNDVPVSVLWDTYINDVINFSNTPYYVGSNSTTSTLFKGRMSHVFLDTSYYDLSVDANRRLFTEYGPNGLMPAKSQVSLNPILYVCVDSENPGINFGYGGDFVQHGVMAQSQVGPSDYNAPATQFAPDDGYLYRSDYIPGLDGFVITFSILFILNKRVGRQYLFVSETSGGARNRGVCVYTDGVDIHISAASSVGGTIGLWTLPVPEHRWQQVDFSLDTRDFTTLRCAVNGALVPVVIKYQLGYAQSIGYGIRLGVGSDSVGGNRLDGALARVWLDSKYVDLADNPFWENGRTVYLGDNGEIPASTLPVVYMPMVANRPGENRGAGADFDENVTFKGARGPSEYWARSVTASDHSAGLHATASGLQGLSTAALFIAFDLSRYAGSDISTIFRAGSNDCQLRIYNSAKQVIFDFCGSNSSVDNWSFKTAGSLNTTGWNFLFLDFDNSAPANTRCILNGTSGVSFTDTRGHPVFSSSQALDLLTLISGVDIGCCYIADSVIGFDDEAVRLLFVDAFGYPVPLQPSIDAGLIPPGVVDLRFDDLTALGFNAGTGGDFVINGTVTPGADVGA